MDAFQIGPLVVSADRLFAAVGLLTLVLGGEIAARRGGAKAADVGWGAAAVVVVGARLGFVLANLGIYHEAPASALYLWQGGFEPWWGVAAGGVFVLGVVLRARKRAAPVLVAGLLGLGAWLAAPAIFGGPQEPRTLPDATLARLDGTRFELTARDGPTVLNLWATWCPPCRRELPMLARVASEASGARLVLAAQGESPEVVRAYLGKHGVPATHVALDRGGLLGDALGTVGLPTTLFFDRDGRLVQSHVGEISEAALRSGIEDVSR